MRGTHPAKPTYHIGEVGVWVHNARCCDLDAVKDLYKTKAETPNATYVKLKASGSTLTKNLEAVGIPKPAGTQAHHTVGAVTDEGKRTRTLLQKLGIDVNSPANGVFLPGCGASKAVGMIHCGKHTEDYEKAVWKDIQQATNKDEAIQILSDIRAKLLSNTYIKLNKSS